MSTSRLRQRPAHLSRLGLCQCFRRERNAQNVPTRSHSTAWCQANRFTALLLSRSRTSPQTCRRPPRPHWTGRPIPARPSSSRTTSHPSSRVMSMQAPPPPSLTPPARAAHSFQDQAVRATQHRRRVYLEVPTTVVLVLTRTRTPAQAQA